jgi:hypothetical protein
MKVFVLALALCCAISSVEAAPKVHPAKIHAEKVKKGKIKGQKPPKRQNRSRARVN